MIATITSKGQLTLPIEARRKIGLKTGSRVQVVITPDDQLRVIPLAQSITSLKGMLGKPRRTLSLEDMQRVITKASKQP